MSKKKQRKEQRIKAEEARKNASSQAKPVRKVFLLRLYDRMFPGDYTPQQDKRHLIGMCCVLIAIATILAFSWAYNIKQYERSTSAKLIIPASSFVGGQEGNVAEMLEGYGFKEISQDEDGNIVSYGTPEMVQAYKDSYEERSLKLARQKLKDNYVNVGIASITPSDDAKTLTIKTYWNLADSSTIMKAAMTDDDIAMIIATFSTWCQMNNDGEKMTTVFVDAETGEEYRRTTQLNANSILAELEVEERASSQQSTQSSSQDSEQSQEEQPAEEGEATNNG